MSALGIIIAVNAVAWGFYFLLRRQRPLQPYDRWPKKEPSNWPDSTKGKPR